MYRSILNLYILINSDLYYSRHHHRNIYIYNTSIWKRRKYMIYKTAKHSGGLKECLETEMPIDTNIAIKLIEYGIYRFYSYDERIKANRYMIVDIDKNIGLPTWLHEYK